MKRLGFYGVRFLVVLLLALAVYNNSGRATGEGGGSGGGSGSGAGTTWTLRIPGFNELSSVTYGNGLFVAVGGSYSSSTIHISSNGATWTEQTSPTSNYLNGVTYGNGTFVAVGSYGTILTSP